MNENEISGRAADTALIDLGVVLGQTQAFGVVAGRCSAAQAERIKRLRDEKLYQRCIPSWEDFCVQYLKISRREADRTIQIWEEFGPAYFELSQLTRVSPEIFREIAPAVEKGVLHFEGEAIELQPENARKVAAVVAEMRRSVRMKKPAGPPEDLPRTNGDADRGLGTNERLIELEKRFAVIIAEFEELSGKGSACEEWPRFTSLLIKVRSALDRIALESGLT